MQPKKTHLRLSGVLSTSGRLALAAISSAAATIAVLNFYLAPKNLPVLNGIQVNGCDQTPDEPTPSEIIKFVDRAAKYNRQYVFVKELGVFGYAYCKTSTLGRKTSPKQSRASAKTKVNDKTGDFEIEFQNLPGYNGVTIKVRTPKDYPFATSVCGEVCIGAEGVYQIKASFVEGWGTLEFAPAPIVDKVANAHECTLKTLAAESWWERKLACY